MALWLEGYAIVSADGMLADEKGVMPASLFVDEDQKFLSDRLDSASLILHGKNSHERQPNSPNRKRLVVSRSVRGLSPTSQYPLALIWNPEFVPLERAAEELGIMHGTVAILGGTDVYGHFLGLYDAFSLSCIPSVRIPRGRSVFPEVPDISPSEVLDKSGLTKGPSRILESSKAVTMTYWSRAAERQRAH
jgi:dihydrofolate reductase